MSIDKIKNFKKLSVPALGLLAALFSANYMSGDSDKNDSVPTPEPLTGESKITKAEPDYSKSAQASLTNLIEKSNLSPRYQKDEQASLANLINESVETLSFPQDAVLKKIKEDIALRMQDYRASFEKDARFMQRLKDKEDEIRYFESLAQKFAKLAGPPYQGIAQEIVYLFPAIAAQESRYNPGAYNKKSGASGAFQITKVAMLGLIPYLEKIKSKKFKSVDEAMQELKDSRVSAKLALSHLLYVVMRSELFKELIDLRIALDMDEKKFNRFAALVMLNAYNTGQGAVALSLKNFLKAINSAKEAESRKVHSLEKRAINYSPEYMSLASLKKMNALEIFHVFTQMAKKYKWHKTYGNEALEYTLRILAARELLSYEGLLAPRDWPLLSRESVFARGNSGQDAG